MMKKLLAFIAALLVLGSVAMAEVTVKDLGDGTAELTFFYGNPKAAEVVVAGSWTDWQNAAEPMTKVEQGWEYKKVFPADSVLKYKFISDGNWTFDFKAPDKVDDGFGGNNGLVEVAKLVALEKARAAGDAEALAKLASSGLKFGTFTQVNLATNLITRNIADPTKAGIETDSVQFRAKSYWKISGDIVPNMPTYIEIQAFDATKDLYKVDATGKTTTELGDGVNNTGTGLLFDPFYYMQGDAQSKLGHFKAGLNTPYVNFETGYNWAKPSVRSSIIWETVTDNDANAGYAQYSNGSAIQQFGDIKVDAAIVPNMSTGNMGMRDWLNVSYADMYSAEVQWDVKSLAANQAAVSEFFEDYTGNLLAGGSVKVDGVDLRGQVSVPVSKKTVKDAVAYQVNGSYSTGLFGVTAKLGDFGPNAYLMYGEDDDVKNNASEAFIALNPWVNAVDGAKVGLDATLNTTWEYKLADVHNYDFKLYTDLDLEKLAARKMALSVFGKVNYDVEPASGADAFTYNEAGAKFTMSDVSEMVPSLEVNYGIQKDGDVKLFNTLISTVNTKPGIGIDVGLGLRTMLSDATAAQKDANAMLAFLLGADYKVKALRDGKLYGAFVYNMDPYEDWKDNIEYSEYRPDRDIDDYAGKAQLRLGMLWDF